MKICTKCKEEKAEGEFNKRKSSKDGLDGWCKECALESTNKYKKNNLEKVRKQNRESKRKWREENPDACRESHKKWVEANRERMSELRKENRRNDRFGTLLKDSAARAKKLGYVPCVATAKEVEAAFTGRCAVCSVPEMECTTKLHLDHCHKSGRLRGFLCYKCNHALGLLGDNEELLVDALHYLMKGEFK